MSVRITNEQKLITLGVAESVAYQLVMCGLDTPKKIKAATSQQLQAKPVYLSLEQVQALRTRFAGGAQ